MNLDCPVDSGFVRVEATRSNLERLLELWLSDSGLSIDGMTMESSSLKDVVTTSPVAGEQVPQAVACNGQDEPSSTGLPTSWLLSSEPGVTYSRPSVRL